MEEEDGKDQKSPEDGISEVSEGGAVISMSTEKTHMQATPQEADCDIGGDMCRPPVLCGGLDPDLRGAQEAVGSGAPHERSEDHSRVPDAEDLHLKRRKLHPKKRLVRESAGAGDRGRPVLEWENGEAAAEAALDMLSSLAEALEYLERMYSTNPTHSHLTPDLEGTMEPGVIYEDEEMAEVELVAEMWMEHEGTYPATQSGIFGRDRHWRIKKSACLQPPVRSWKSRLLSLPFRSCSFGSLLRRDSRSSTDAHAPQETLGPRTRRNVADCCGDTGTAAGQREGAPVLSAFSAAVADPLSTFCNQGAAEALGPGRTFPESGGRRDLGPSQCWGLTLGNGSGVSNGQQRPPNEGGGSSSTSGTQHPQPPMSALEKMDSSCSSPSTTSFSPASYSPHPQDLPGSGLCSLMSQELDIYDPFHPTDEENMNGDFEYGDSPEKETEDQKYDPFDPTGSNPSSSVQSPSPYEDDDEEEEGNVSHPEDRISEALAGIYDENSLSQDFPFSEKDDLPPEPGPLNREHEATPERETPADPTPASCVTSKDSARAEPTPELYSPSSSIDMELPNEPEAASPEPSEEPISEDPVGVDSTDKLAPESPEVTLEPRRRVFAVDLSKAEFASEAEPKSKLEIKVSLESVPKVEPKSYLRMEKIAKLGGEPKLRHKSRRSCERRERSSKESERKYEDSEIEEGEIVPQEEDRFSPMRLFRSRCRILERPLRVVEGDDFLSLHADSDEERALQIDFGESQADTRWKGVDLRRKITNQRRERYRKQSVSPSEPKRPSKSRSSSRSRKKAKREHKRSKERKRSKETRSAQTSWSQTKKSRSKSKDRKRLHQKTSRSRSWSPSISTSISAVGSSRTSTERRKRRSKEKRRRWSRSVSTDRSRKDKRKEKHRSEGKKKKKRSRSKSRERRSERREKDKERRFERREKDKERERRSIMDEAKPEMPLLTERRRRDHRTVVPPSIQDLNDNDLFTIKRTITVNPTEKLDDARDRLRTPEAAGKREVLYDSEGLSFETFSDRELLDDRESKSLRLFERHTGRPETSKRKTALEYEKKRIEEEESKQKAGKEGERNRSYSGERSSRERCKKFKESPHSEMEALRVEKEKARLERDKTPKKLKAPHKGTSSRKVKLQSKVAVLIREGVSSTTTSVKEAGSIGVKFSRDKESRSPFIKSEEKLPDFKAGRPKPEGSEPTELALKPKKVRGLKTKTGIKRAKIATSAGGAMGTSTVAGKIKGTGEKRKKKLKSKSSLKKSKADSCSKEMPSPPRAAEEPIWSGSEQSESKEKPASPTKAANEQELTPDSQTVDSSCKTPDVSFMPEEPPLDLPRKDELEVDSMSEPKEEPRAQATQMPWNLQAGVDCTTSGVLALTALLFKMEEANMASRAKAQELIQATNQILNQTKPSTSLTVQPPPPPPPSHTPVTHSAPSYLLHSSLGCSSSPPSPPGLPSSISQASAGTMASMFFTASSSSETGKREGSTSSEGHGDTDKYLKKLHTQERAVEEVKLAIKPYYQKKEITKEEYKDILRKAVHKICHSKSGEINPVKVNNLVKAYVQRYKYFRKHGRKMDEEESSSYRSSREHSGLDKGSFSLPLI